MPDFLKTLLEIRKDYDIWPWLEVVQSQMSAEATAESQAQFAVVPPYPVIFRELPFIGWDVSDPTTGAIGDLSIGAGTYNWSTGNAPEQFQQAQVPVTTEQMLGAYNDRWVPSRGGTPLNKYEQWNAQFILGNRYNNGGGLLGSGQLYTGLRGYQLYKKGSIGDPLQLTREEVLADGKTQLMPYSFTGIVTVTFEVGSSKPYSTPLKLTPPSGFDADFMVHSLRVAPADVPTLIDGSGTQSPYIYSYIPAVLVGVQPAQRQLSFQGGTFGTRTISMAPWQMYYGRDFSLTAWGLNQTTPVWLPPTSRLDTQWDFPVPITFKKNEQINLFAQPLALDIKTSGSYTMPMEFVFSGELVIRG